ncbi:B-cell scaffold protein with ankyrin repeats-like isoform X2 [Montipora foliosa]|uniref:B-cell scaffold protein with ankyrin repeats-like isoform X2 n=1 Tax=Montipora foliosa TaxID=591990 RepID=UPI0035F105E0
MHSQGNGRRGSNESSSSDVKIKAIVPERVEHNCKEKIAIIFDHRLNVQKSRDPFIVEFAGSGGRLQVHAILANSSTLILDTPEYKKPCDVTVYVHHGNRILGQHRFEFISRSDSLHRLLYEALDPIRFMCEALQISPPEVHELDKRLAGTFKAKAPNGFSFLGTQHVEVTDKSDAEHPTLLHFACKYGLTELIQVLLCHPGAREACSLKNCDNQRPYNVAENHGFYELANEIRTFQDQGDTCKIGYVEMGTGNREEEALYVRMQKSDGSYCYVLKNFGHQTGLYTDVKREEEKEDGYYEKMCGEGGRDGYVPMKEGVCLLPTQMPKKFGYVNDPRESDPPIYSNMDSEDNQVPGEDGVQELYEEMASGQQEEFYEDMTSAESNLNPDDQLYVEMQPGESENFANPYICETGPVTSQADSRSLMKMLINERVLSGDLSEKEAGDFILKLRLSTNQDSTIARTPSVSSRSSTSTTSSHSSGISVNSEPGMNSEAMDPDAVADDGEEEVLRQSREDLLKELRNSQKGDYPPPPLPPPDYEKSQGRRQMPRQHRRTQTADSQGISNKPESQTPLVAPRVQRRQSAPLTGPSSDFQTKESGRIGQPAIPEVTQQEPQNMATRHAAQRRPLPIPSSEDSRPPQPPPPSDRLPDSVRQTGVSVLPSPRVPESPPPVVPRRAQLPPSRGPR